MTMRRRTKITQTILGIILCFVAFFYAFPYIWMITTSLKTDDELYNGRILPERLSLIQYDRLFNGYELRNRDTVKFRYPEHYKNSVLVTGSSLILVLTLDALAAFAFAKYQFRGKQILFWLMMITMMLPIYATLIPSFYLFSRILHWTDTYKVLIIPGVVDAYGIFLLTQYMKSIPSELLDAARIDGAGPLRIFVRIIVPLSRPVLGTLAIFKFLLVWNDYLWPLVMVHEEKMYTLTIGIAQMQVRQGMVVWGVQMAAAVVATVPVLIIVYAMQRQFLRGITAGALKG
jgi:ABC-type glycerol-3-phosphate transport system permease component